MNTKPDQILVLGAGIGGLSAAFELLKRGKKVVVVEKGAEMGGLMRAVRHNEFSVDLGQKQFYDRIPEVHAFFCEILGDAYRAYPYRIGVVYRSRIFERDRRYKGFRRGMPFGLFVAGLADLLFHRLRYLGKQKSTLQDLAWSQKGRLFSRIFSQGFDEKLKCRPWSSVPAKTVQSDAPDPNHARLKGIRKTIDKGRSGQEQWFHPYRGSGGLIDALHDRIREMGGEIMLETELKAIRKKENRIVSVELQTGEEYREMQVSQMVCSVRLEILAGLLGFTMPGPRQGVSFRRGVIIVYIFLDAPPSFPHTCLHITKPDTRIGRVTNYGAYVCGMTPKGKNCLAFEIFCTREDHLLEATDEDMLGLVEDAFGNSGILEFGKMTAFKVLRLPLGDAASNWRDYQDDPLRKQVYEDLAAIENLYNVNRTGIDKTIHAAMLAAQSIESRSREGFLKLSAPEVATPWSQQ